MSAHFRRDILIRLIIVGGGLLAFAGVLIYQILNIQLAEGDQWKELSQQMSHTYLDIPAVRGNIYAADGSLLATSVPRYDVRFDTKAVHPDTFRLYVSALAARLASKVGARSYPEYIQWLNQARKRGDRYLLLCRKVSFLDIKEMRQWPIFRLGTYKGGFIVEEETIRSMPFGSLASRTVGFYRLGIGGVGIERACNSELSGVDGKRLVQKISGGYRPMNDENAIDPVQGMDVYTTIDIHIQDAAEDALRKALLKHQAEYGCVIVMEVGTGKIRAISNLSKVSEGAYAERFNYSIGAGFEPGSTFKILSAMALLEDEKAKPGDSVDIFQGKYRFYNATMEDSETGLYDRLSLSDVIIKSSNVGISRMVFDAYRNDPESFLKHIYKLKLDQPIGLGLPGEAKPVIKKHGARDWYGTTLPWMSIGYEMSITPMHVVALYNAIANNGVMLRPYLIEAYGKSGRVTEKVETEVLVKRMCTTSTLDALKEMLEGVVLRGTARNLNQLEFSVAGKTGTSLIAADNKGYVNRIYNASFVGYFPADEPRYTCFVLVSNPAVGGYYGGTVAAPIFREIAQKIYAHEMRMELSPEEHPSELPSCLLAKEDIYELNDELGLERTISATEKQFWVRTGASGSRLLAQPALLKGNVMPDLRGMGLKDVKYILENKGFSVRYSGVGKVSVQQPAPGSTLKKGQQVWIQLGTS